MNKFKKVLIIDDSKLARLTLFKLLSERGLDVVEASSVAEALEVLEANADIEAIFMDVMMPEKNGFEGLDIIKSNPKFKHIPCSMYSGELSSEAQKKAVASGAQAYLFKPASGDGIESVLDALESNTVAEEVRQFTTEGEKSTTQPNAEQRLATLEHRTKNLARVITRERKEKETIYDTFDKRITSLSDKMGNAKLLAKGIERESVERQRVESELGEQIVHLNGSIKKVLVLSSTALVFSIIALLLAFVT